MENPCGDAYPSTIKSGFPTPSIKKLANECNGLIDVTTFTSAFTGVKKVKTDKIDKINGIFLTFFIISNLICCYNITVCNNITFICQAIK